MFGSFITPSAKHPQEVVALTQLAERSGLDLATFQDHPYQPAFLDTWTLMSYLAAVTTRIRLAPNVLNLPLRQPAIIARSAASLDLLSGGRFELGLGAGAFWEAIEANGGRKLSPGESLTALEEAIAVIRGIWDTEQRGGVRTNGSIYRAAGAKRGPKPAHDIGIWIGGYKPRMLRLIGRLADGWLPSLGYLKDNHLADMNAYIDEGAAEAGRDPSDIRRLLNLSGPLEAEQLAELALRHRVTGFILMADDAAVLQRFGEEVAPATRELVANETQPLS